MGQNLTTAEVIHLMLEQCSKGSKTVADECGMNYSTFMRKVSPVDDGTSLSVEELLIYIEATGSDMILNHLNERRGRMYVPFPKGIRKGTDPRQDINRYSGKFMRMVGKMLAWWADPEEEERRQELLELMRIHQGDTENMRRRIRDHKLHQTEMEL